MRAAAALVLALVAGCGGGSGDDGSSCSSDSDCGGGNVCARDGSCWPSSEVHSIKVVWTINGQPASATTCSSFPDLFVNFESQTTDFGFAPVPCVAGEFPIDKLPTAYVQVEVGDNSGMYFDQFADFDASGTASFDLVP
jgi:hypothetical protein